MSLWLGKYTRPSIYGLVAIFIVISQMISGSNFLAQISRWSSPETIPGISLESYPPILVADENRTVHAFLSQWVVGGKAVIYTQWTLEHGWSVPIDILLSPYGNEARVTGASLGENGMMHLVFYGGNSISGDIYYSKAPASDANNARSWSAPVLVGEYAGDPESATVVEDSQGDLHIIYFGKRDGNGLYSTTSKDGGDTWSDLELIFLADSEAPFVWRIQAIKSNSGWLHVIWNVYDKGGQGRGVYYARFQTGTDLWGDIVLLAETKEGLGAQTPAIIEYNDTLYAFYIIPGKINVRRSVDNGLTWDDPNVPFSRHTGVNGSLSLVIDGNNELHLFFGQRISGNPDIHGMWHSVLVNNRWTEPDAVIKGPRIVDKEGLNGFDPYEAHAVVSQGNVILVTWRTDPGDIKDNGVWFSYAVVNAPEFPVATLPLVDIKATPSQTPVTVPTLLINDTPQIPLDKERRDQNPISWIVVGAVVMGVLRVTYILIKRGR